MFIPCSGSELRYVPFMEHWRVTVHQWFSTGVPSEQFRGSASCLWKINFVCVYQKHDPILKSCARNIRLKFLIEFFTRINVIFYSLY